MFINTSYGTLSYSFSVLVTTEAAGGTLGKTAVSIGFAAALLVSGAAALVTGTVADRFGSRRLMASGSLVGGVGLAAFSRSAEPWQAIVLLALVVGPAMAATSYEPVYVLMNRWFEPAERPRAYGVLTLVSGFSITIFTPLTAQLVDAYGWRTATMTLALILVAVGLTVPLLLLREPPPAPVARRASFGGVIADAWAGVRSGDRRFWLFSIAFFAGTAAFSGFSFHIVAELESRGFAADDTARVIALAGIVSLPTRLILPAMSGRVSSLGLLCVCMGVLAVAAVLASESTSWWQVWLYVAIFGSVFGAIYPLRALVTAERFSSEYFGRLLGAQALFVAAGRALGPAAVGLASRGDHYETSFRLAAVVLVLSAAGMLAAFRVRSSRPGLEPVSIGLDVRTGGVDDR